MGGNFGGFSIWAIGSPWTSSDVPADARLPSHGKAKRPDFPIGRPDRVVHAGCAAPLIEPHFHKRHQLRTRTPARKRAHLTARPLGSISMPPHLLGRTSKYGTPIKS